MILNQLTKNYLKKSVSGYLSKNQTKESLSKYLRLDLGENLLGCSPKVLKKLKEISEDKLRFYTDPAGEKIKTIIANLYNLKKENVIVANSSNEIIDFLPKMIINPYDKILICVPTFFRFIESSLASGGKIIYQRLKEKYQYQYNNNFVDEFVKIANTNNIKLAWFCNPNNPTGSVASLDIIAYILKKTKSFLIVDEAFYEFYDLTNSNSGIKLIEKNKNLIVIRTLSKAYGLAGLRFGYAMGNKKIIEAIENYRNTLSMTSALTQELAIVALKDQQWLKKNVLETKKIRLKLFNKVKSLKNFNLIEKSQTNIYLLKHKNKDLYEELKKRGVLVADFRNAKGLENKKYVRITVGNKKDNQFLLSILKKI